MTTSSAALALSTVEPRVLCEEGNPRTLPQRKWPVAGILLVAFWTLGAALRFCALDLHSFWYDEVVVMRIARAPSLADMVQKLMSTDKSAAPLHPLLLRGWIAIWGPSEAAARALSATFSLLALVALSAVAWFAFRSRVAVLVATALMAVSPIDLELSMENRMYCMLLFWTVAAWALLFSFRRSRGVFQELGFGLCLIGLAYTHPLGGFMILALGLGYLLDTRHSRLSWRRWLIIQALAFAAIVPWLPHYLDHPPEAKDHMHRMVMLYAWIQAGLGYPSGYLPIVLGLAAANWLVPPRIVRVWQSSVRIQPDERIRTGSMLALWILVPLCLIFLYSFFRHSILCTTRYEFYLVPGLILLLAGAVRFRPMMTGGMVAVLTLCYVPSLLGARVFNAHCKADWRGAMRVVLNRSPRPTVMLALPRSHWYFEALEYYVPESVPLVSLDDFFESQRAGVLDPGRDYWLIQDRLGPDRANLRELPLRRHHEPILDDGRLTATILDSTRVIK